MRFKIIEIKEGDIKKYNEIPPKYKEYTLPAKNTLAVLSPVADILYQENTVKECTQSNIRFFVKKDCEMEPRVEESLSAINCMLMGSVKVGLREYMMVDLLQGQYNAYQVDTSRHIAYFRQGHYEANHFDYTRQAIEPLAQKSEIIRKWLDMIDTNSAASVLPYPGIIPDRMYRIIDELKHFKVESALDEEWMYNRIMSALLLVLRDQEKRDYSFFKEDNSLYETLGGYIAGHLHQRITLESLASAYNVSVAKLKKDFPRYFGQPFKEYFLEKKMVRAKELLRHPERHSIQDIATLLGYEYAANFTKAYKNFYGKPPRLDGFE